jgi:hypothetical protein
MIDRMRLWWVRTLADTDALLALLALFLISVCLALLLAHLYDRLKRRRSE